MKCVWCSKEASMLDLTWHCDACGGKMLGYPDGSRLYIKQGYRSRGNWLEDDNVIGVPLGALFIVDEELV